MNTYLITLKPIDKFFFGKEQTFGESNYFAQSHYFPQQTQILGMLRREILVQNGFMTQKKRGEWVDRDYDRAKKFVGSGRFEISQKKRQELGKIDSLSPIFLLDKNRMLHYPTSKDLGISFNEIDGLVELRLEDGKIYTEKVAKDIETLLCSANKEHCYVFDNIFKEDTQVGIMKSRTGASNDNAFFRKSSYKLDLDFSFAFVVNLDNEVVLNDSIITLGAEQSSFKMEVIKDAPLCQNYKQEIVSIHKADSVDKLVLLSDTYIDQSSADIFSKAAFAISEGVAVRTINSKVTKKEKDVDLTKYRFKKSITYNFFKQGTVFYNPKEALKELIGNENLQQIGYNQYIIIEKGEKR